MSIDDETRAITIERDGGWRYGKPEDDERLRCAGKRCPFLTYQRKIEYGCFCRAMLERADAIEPYEARTARLDRIAATTPPEPLYREYRCAGCRARFKARQPAMFCRVCLGDTPAIRRKARARR